MPYTYIVRIKFSFILLFFYCQSLGQTVFKNVTDSSGIKHHFEVYQGLFGGGACVFDLNNDGFEDLFLAGGMRDDALYINNGGGKFTDIYKGSGLESSSHYVTQGAVSADVNRDGWVDLFITTISSRDSVMKIPRAENLLFLNNGNSTFRNVTNEYKLDQLMSFSTAACFGDFNLDGYPDLYVCNYFEGYEGKLSVINDATIVNAEKTAKGLLLENVDGKYFSNVYADYDISHKGFAFGAVFTDYDNDHDVDLFINHDFGFKAQPNVLLNNQYPRESFADVSKERSMSLQMNAMGTGIGDINNDGLLDYYVTNIRFNHMMVSQGRDKPFIDKAKALGLGFVDISWGANFADFDHDTDLDLFVANGDLNPNCVPRPDFYFVNENGHFSDKAYIVGLNDYGVGRGSVVFDMDNDGDLDLLVVNQKPVLNYPVPSETRLYRNDSTQGNWLKVALKGADSELHGLGSRVEVIVQKQRLIREIDGGSSFSSQNSSIAHFGLGDATIVDSLIVIWLGGKRQVLTNQPINKLLTVVETPGKPKFPWMLVGSSFAGLISLFAIYQLRRRKLKG